MQTILAHILDLIAKGEPLVLATIISHEGSTPRDTGTRFVIHKDGSTFGTIGGGLVELKVTEAAAEIFENGQSRILDYDMSQSHLKADSMICGGKMSTLVEYFQPDETARELFSALQTVYTERREAMLIIDIEQLKREGSRTSHAVLMDGKTVFSSISRPLESPVFAAEMKSEIRDQTAITKTIEGTDYWVEALQFPKKLFLFGAGHVARPTADIAARTGFQTTVVDDRESVISSEYFTENIELIKVDEFDGCLDQVQVDRDSYVVILTRGHKSDKTVLAQALKSDAFYIGMIGSRKKRNTIYNLLLAEGFSQSDIGRVNCPVGIEIGADTPDEIAVSIAAELIKTRARQK